MGYIIILIGTCKKDKSSEMQARGKLQIISWLITENLGMLLKMFTGFAFNKGFQTFELYNLHLDSGSNSQKQGYLVTKYSIQGQTMTKEKRINIRISPELERQLTVLQKSLYQSQRYAQDKGMSKKPVKILSISQVARIILVNNFKRPGSKFKRAEDLNEEEEVEAQLLQLGDIDFWNNEKLLDKNLADSEELEEIDYLHKETDRLNKIARKSGFKETEEHSRQVEELEVRIDKINLRTEEEQAEARTAKEKRKR